jgi:CDP-glucose 4,6-dehydratase
MFNNVYAGKHVLVTGHTGFKGSWLSVWLLSLGAKVTGISDKVPTQPSMFEALGLSEKLTHIVADIRDGERMKNLMADLKPDMVFHMAAQPIVSLSYSDPLDTLTTNIIGTANLLEALRLSNHTCTAVFITSDKCYENVEWTWGYRENDRLGGKDPYSASKAGAELMIYTYFHSFLKNPGSNVRIVSTRAGNVIGGGDWADSRIVPDCVRAWAQNQSVEIRRPKATRPWQHVMEPVSGYLAVGAALHLNPQLTGESFNFGPAADQSFTVHQLLEEIALNWHFDGSHDKFIVDLTPTFHEAGLLKLNCDKALHELSWKPALRFEDAARLTATWYDKYYHQGTEGLYEYTLDQIQEYTDAAIKLGIAWTAQ